MGNYIVQSYKIQKQHETTFFNIFKTPQCLCHLWANLYSAQLLFWNIGGDLGELEQVWLMQKQSLSVYACVCMSYVMVL